jgi:hypothetical protein
MLGAFRQGKRAFVASVSLSHPAMSLRARPAISSEAPARVTLAARSHDSVPGHVYR